MPGFAKNRAGNSVDVRFNGRKENLHSLWDTAIVQLEQRTPAEIAARIKSSVTADEREQLGGRGRGKAVDLVLSQRCNSDSNLITSLHIPHNHRCVRHPRCSATAPLIPHHSPAHRLTATAALYPTSLAFATDQSPRFNPIHRRRLEPAWLLNELYDQRFLMVRTAVLR